MDLFILGKGKTLDKIYTAIPINDLKGALRGELRVVMVQWKGRYKTHIREYYLNERGKFKPGRGITLSFSDVERVAYGLQLAAEDIKNGVFHESEEGYIEEPDEISESS